MSALPLSEWETFNVIVGSSAAALTGLMFVVIALRAESRSRAGAGGVRAFGTPTVVHFCAVLLLAAVESMPHHTATTLGTSLGAIGAAGLAFSLWVLLEARRQTDYAPVLSDWAWHVVLPLAAYAALLIAGVVLGRATAPALDAVAAAALLLLFVGIHNAWDSAIWFVATRR